MITSTRDVGGRDLLFTALHAGAARVVGALGELFDDYNVTTAKVFCLFVSECELFFLLFFVYRALK